MVHFSEQESAQSPTFAMSARKRELKLIEGKVTKSMQKRVEGLKA